MSFHAKMISHSCKHYHINGGNRKKSNSKKWIGRNRLRSFYQCTYYITSTFVLVRSLREVAFFRDPNLFARSKQSSERWSIRHMMLLYKKNITLRGVQTHSAVHYGRDGGCRIKSQTLDVLRRVLKNEV